MLFYIIELDASAVYIKKFNFQNCSEKISTTSPFSLFNMQVAHKYEISNKEDMIWVGEGINSVGVDRGIFVYRFVIVDLVR